MMNESEQRQQFVAMVRRYDPLLMRVSSMYGYGRPYSASDLYQDIVCKMWEKRSMLLSAQHPTSWIFQLAKHEAVSKIRRWNTRNKFIQTDSDAVENAPNEDHEHLHHLYELMRLLDDDERAWVMLYLDGYTYDEMAQMMQVPLSTVGTRLYRVKVRLKELDASDNRINENH